MKDTPNPFVVKQYSKESSAKLSKEIEDKVGVNTREEIARRLGTPIQDSKLCPTCGKPL